MSLFVQETYVNKTRNEQFGKSDVYEAGADSVGVLFLGLQREFGRCTGKVFIGDGEHIGWVFESLQEYTDSREKYLREVWVTVHESEPTIETTVHYHVMEDDDE